MGPKRVRPARLIARAALGLALLVQGLATTLPAGAADSGPTAASTSAFTTPSQERPNMWMTVGTRRFGITLEDNPTARAFMQLLPATLEMAELNSNEKHAALPRTLPTNATRPGKIRMGDLMLYGRDTLVVFYKTFDSPYSYTRIGRVEDAASLEQVLGSGDLRVGFEVQ
jgi:hypothetical protein